MKIRKVPFILTMAMAMTTLLGTVQSVAAQEETRTVTDGNGREVEIPKTVDSIVCSGVGALRYTCYMQAQDLVVGVEDYEKEKSISRGYSIVHGEDFAKLPVIGTNGEPYAEEIIIADPDVIVMSAFGSADPEHLQETTGIPVVVVPGNDDGMMGEGAYETLRIMGEVYGKESHAEELINYLEDIQTDLDNRTASVPDDEKPTVYVGGVSFKGAHGFEGTEAGYSPFAAIHAKNLADETSQKGAFDIELEKILEWDPDVLFIDFNGLQLINEDYTENPDFYNQLTAVQEGRVYSQISFRSSAVNLDTALADTYYAASVLYPEQFSDVNIEEKVSEIYETLLGQDISNELRENGYEFRPLTIGE